MSTKHIVFVIAAICLTLGAVSSARSAAAEALRRQGKVDALLRLVPDDVQARIERGGPGDLEWAAATATAESGALIELALAAESKGDLKAARGHLEEAMRRDATFRPRWAMVNLLVRHGEPREVLPAAAKAAATYEGDLTALFDLCLRVGAAPAAIYRDVVPGRLKAQREYLVLLLQRGLRAETLPAALRLADSAHPDDRDLLLRTCDRMLESGAGAQAAALWEALPRFGPTGGRCLDWRRETIAGITIIETGDSLVRLDLNGTQPALATVLRRTVVVEPGRRYHLRAITGGEDRMQKAVEWRWDEMAIGGGDQPNIEVEALREISELALVIRRLPGERAAEGALEITNIRIEKMAAALTAATKP